eukprot:4053790-Pyramimonas_sp.AAC.1
MSFRTLVTESATLEGSSPPSRGGTALATRTTIFCREAKSIDWKPDDTTPSWKYVTRSGARTSGSRTRPARAWGRT